MIRLGFRICEGERFWEGDGGLVGILWLFLFFWVLSPGFLFWFEVMFYERFGHDAVSHDREGKEEGDSRGVERGASGWDVTLDYSLFSSFSGDGVQSKISMRIAEN